MPGAGTRVLVNWLKWLEKNDYGIFVSAPMQGWLKEKLSGFKNKKVINAEYFIPSKREYPRFLLLVIRLCLFVFRNRIDVIHCNSDIAYFTACLVAKITRRPIVTHLRFHYRKEFYSWLFGGWRSPDLVLLVSESFSSEESPKIKSIVPDAPIKVLHNCIDINDYPHSTGFKKSGSKNVLYPAAISERKRQAQLYELDWLLRQKGHFVTFIAAGKVNEEAYKTKCEQNALEYPENGVEFVGHISNIADQYANSFLSLTLSEYETFGYSVLESMVSGIPVVGYKIDAVSEVLGESNYLVNLDDVESLAETISYLVNNQKETEAYSDRLRQRAVTFFSPDYICPKLLKLYDELL